MAEVTITNLMSSTNYSIEVAAVNSAGTGDYSGIYTAKTNGNYFNHTIFLFVNGEVLFMPFFCLVYR